MDRRDHYLQTALTLFAEHGYHGVSMDQLVATAGGSKATLYRYFDSKQQLFTAIIDDLASARLPDEATLTEGDVDLAESLRRLGSAIAAAALSEQVIVLLRLAVGEQSRFPELGRLLFERGPAASYQRFAEFIAARAAAGELRVDDPQIAAEQFIAGIVGHQQLRMALGVSAPTTPEIEARVTAAVHTFLAAHATNVSGGDRGAPPLHS